MLRTPYQGCPLCDSSVSSLVGEVSCQGHPLWSESIPSTMRWVQCETCGHVYTDGYFTAELGAHDRQKLSYLRFEQERWVSSRMIDKVLVHLPSDRLRRWLDVGMGNGSLLLTALEYGFMSVGIDIKLEPVQALAALELDGLVLEHVSLMDYAPTETFDVLSMADVLEHLPFPKEALLLARALLTEGGLLLVSCPNIDSPAWALLSADERGNPYWGELEHFHNFGRRRLHLLLSECGFEPIAYSVSERYRAGMEIIARRLA